MGFKGGGGTQRDLYLGREEDCRKHKGENGEARGGEEAVTGPLKTR